MLLIEIITFFIIKIKPNTYIITNKTMNTKLKKQTETQTVMPVQL